MERFNFFTGFSNSVAFQRRHFLSVSAFVLACAFAVAPVTAQTVLVDPMVPANGSSIFNSIQGALDSFATPASTNGPGTNYNNPLPNIINVTTAVPTTGTACVDSIAATTVTVMDGDITIQSLVPNIKATYAGLAAPGAFGSTAIAWRQDVNLTINDLNIIPANTVPGIGNLPTAMTFFYATNTPDTTPSVTLNRCVITSNNGSNQPVTTDGKNDPDLNAPGVISIPAAGQGILSWSTSASHSITLNMTDTVIASLSKTTGDGISSRMVGDTLYRLDCIVNINEGCVLANIGSLGIRAYYGSYININGTAAKPVVFRNIGSDAIFLFADTGGQPCVASSNYAHFYSIKGSALKEQENTLYDTIGTVTNTVISSCTASGIITYGTILPPDGESTTTLSIFNTVVNNTGNGGTIPTNYDNASAQIAAPTYAVGPNASNRNIDMENVTLSGQRAGLTGLYNSGSGTFTISDSSIVLDGPNALQGGAVGGPSTITQNNVSNEAVIYANTTDPFSPLFYARALAEVKDWTLY